jgi:hypothetical protein
VGAFLRSAVASLVICALYQARNLDRRVVDLCKIFWDKKLILFDIRADLAGKRGLVSLLRCRMPGQQ